MNEELRCYHVCNFYLSSIQQGIQSAHAQMELFVKYPPTDMSEFYESIGCEIGTELSNKSTLLYEWAAKYKTMIVLNGGMLSDMKESLEFLSSDENPYPFAPFYESEEALGGILTNIAIVLPERIFKMAEWVRFKKVSINPYGKITPDDLSSLDDLNKFDYFMENQYTSFEIELCQWLNKFGLAK